MPWWGSLLISVGLGAIVIPLSGWALLEVHRLRVDLAAVQAKFTTQMEERSAAWASVIAEIRGNCTRHQAWSEGMQSSLARVDRNLVLLCQKSEIDYERPA